IYVAAIRGGFMTTKVFAYGSIYEGMVHFNRLSPLVASKREAWTRGQIFRLKVGYPVLLKDGDDLVPGQVLELKRTDFLMSIVDEVHGYHPTQPEKSLYFRDETQLLDHQGQVMESGWIYYLSPKKLPA